MSLDDEVVMAHRVLVWEAEFTDEFGVCWDVLDLAQKAALVCRVEALSERGPDLGRPAVDRIWVASSQYEIVLGLRRLSTDG